LRLFLAIFVLLIAIGACLLSVAHFCTPLPSGSKYTTNEKRIPENFVEKAITLKDYYEDTSFCEVTLSIPEELDTLLIWKDVSDCSCCGSKKYRLTPSNGCLIQESGFFKNEYCKDSFQRLTILHQCLGENKDLIDTTFLKGCITNVNNDHRDMLYPNPIWIKQELQNITGQPFVILHYFGQDYYCIKPFERITAITVINNTFIGFEWECAPHNDSADFSKKAYQTLESIRIKWKTK
jgi:hypothetical protein